MDNNNNSSGTNRFTSAVASSFQSWREQLTNIVEADVDIDLSLMLPNTSTLASVIPSSMVPLTSKVSPKQQVNDNRWKPMHNFESYIIRDEYSPFPLLGCTAFFSKTIYFTNKYGETNARDGRDHLYVLGGQKAGNISGIMSTSYIDMTQMYHVKDMDWSNVALGGNSVVNSNSNHIPKGRAYHTLTNTSDDTCILFGGLVDSSSSISSSFFLSSSSSGTSNNSSSGKFDPAIYELNCKTKEWIKVTNYTSETYLNGSPHPTFPKSRAYHAACSLGDGNVFIYGGVTAQQNSSSSSSLWPLKSASNNFELLNDLWLYNTQTKTWTLLSSPDISARKRSFHPSARYQHSMVCSLKHQKLYVIGGCNLSNQPFKEILQYDLISNEWSMCGLIPRNFDTVNKFQTDLIVPYLIPARFGASIMFDDFIFIIGGETMISDEKGVGPVLDDVLIYSVQNNFLIKGGVASAKCAVTHHTLLVGNYNLYVIGGKFANGNMVSSITNVASNISNIANLNTSQYNLVQQISLVHTLDRMSFGQPLSSLCDSKTQCPTLITTCVKYLQEACANTRDLFSRKCSGVDLIRFRLHYELGNIENEEFMARVFTPHIVATALLQFLAALPEPLLMTVLYREFLDTLSQFEATIPADEVSTDLEIDDSKLLDDLKAILSKLPENHLKVLYHVLNLFHLIAFYADDTEACIRDLSKQLTHPILRTNNPSFRSVKDDYTDRNGLRVANRVVMKLIEKAPLLFC